MARETWFSNRGIGTLFLLPIPLRGWWLSLGVIVAVTVASTSDLMWPMKIAACLACLGLGYFQSDRWPGGQ
jgi:hypothetical protein